MTINYSYLLLIKIGHISLHRKLYIHSKPYEDLGGERKKMKSTKAKTLALCAVLLVAMVGGIAVAAGDNAKDMGDASNVEKGSVTRGETYEFSIGPGGIWQTSSVLTSGAPFDYDIYEMTVTEPCTVTARVECDCVCGGVTFEVSGIIGLKAGKKTITGDCYDDDTTLGASATLAPGTYKFYVGYLFCPCGYPAGYEITVSAI